MNFIKKLKKFQLTETQKYTLKCNMLANYITKISRPHIDKLNVFLKKNTFNILYEYIGGFTTPSKIKVIYYN